MSRLCLTVLLVSFAARASAGPTGAASAHAAAATGFPGALAGAVTLSLADNPIFGSRMLDALEMHLRTISAMTGPRAVADYLEVTVLGSVGARGAAKRLRATLASEAISPNKASALLIANALARPEQFPETLDALEARRAGLGKQAAKLFADAPKKGVKEVMSALREAGARVKPRGTPLLYDARGEIAAVFDGSESDGRDPVTIGAPVVAPESYEAYGPGGRPRRSGLAPSPARP